MEVVRSLASINDTDYKLIIEIPSLAASAETKTGISYMDICWQHGERRSRLSAMRKLDFGFAVAITTKDRVKC